MCAIESSAHRKFCGRRRDGHYPLSSCTRLGYGAASRVRARYNTKAEQQFIMRVYTLIIPGHKYFYLDVTPLHDRERIMIQKPTADPPSRTSA